MITPAQKALQLAADPTEIACDLLGVAELLRTLAEDNERLRFDHDRHLRCTQVLLDKAKANEPWHAVEVDDVVKQVQAEEVAYQNVNRTLVEATKELVAAVEFTPLSVPARHWVTQARKALDEAAALPEAVTQYARKAARRQDRILALTDTLSQAVEMLDHIAKGGSYDAADYLERLHKMRSQLRM